jgi:transcription initiation factor TFIIIB Brf1 subunit/transcription initiation factor TFIIB
VLNEAFKLLKDIEDNKALKGHSLETKVACVIVFASRFCNKEKKIEDILKYVKTKKRDISHCYKKLKRAFP